MLTTLRNVLRLSAIYTLGDVITKGVAFLLMPLYTRFLTPADYGTMAVTAVIGAVLNPLLSFGLMGAILRFWPRFTDVAERRRFYGAMWLFLIVAPGLVVLGLALWGQPLFAALFRQVPFDPYIRLTLWTAYLSTAFALLPPMLFRAREQAGRFVAFSLTNFAATTLLTIYFVVGQRQGAYGAILAQFIAAVCVALMGAGWMLRDLRPNLQWRQLAPALAYSAPLIPHFLAHWALSVADRAILERYVSLSQVGIYALGYQFGIIYQMVTVSVNNALIPLYSRAAQDEHELGLLPRMATYYVLLIVTLGLAMALMAGEVIALILPPSYHAAADVVPWVVVGYLAAGLYYLPMDVQILLVGKSNPVPLATVTAAIVNIALNFWLIPRLGILAAAMSTAVSYGVMLALIFGISQRAYTFPYEYGRLGKIFLAGLVVLLSGRMLMRFSPLINLGVGTLCVGMFPPSLSVLGFWSDQEKQHLQLRWESCRIWVKHRLPYGKH